MRGANLLVHPVVSHHKKLADILPRLQLIILPLAHSRTPHTSYPDHPPSRQFTRSPHLLSRPQINERSRRLAAEREARLAATAAAAAADPAAVPLSYPMKYSSTAGIRPRAGSAPPVTRQSDVSHFAPATRIQEARRPGPGSPLRGGSPRGEGYSSPAGRGRRQPAARSPTGGSASTGKDGKKGHESTSSMQPPPPELSDAFEQVNLNGGHYIACFIFKAADTHIASIPLYLQLHSVREALADGWLTPEEALMYTEQYMQVRMA